LNETSNGSVSVNRADSSGNNNTLTDNNTVASIIGRLANAADFVRSRSEYFSIADSAQTGLDLTPPFSIAFWVNYDTSGSTDGTLGKGNSLTQYSYQIYRRSSSPYKMTIKLSANGTSATSFDSDSGIPAGSWNHVAVVVNGNTVNWYLNGTSNNAQPGSWTSALYNSSLPFVLGDRASGDGSRIDGKLDEVRIYNRALTAGEISALAK